MSVIFLIYAAHGDYFFNIKIEKDSSYVIYKKNWMQNALYAKKIEYWFKIKRLYNSLLYTWSGSQKFNTPVLCLLPIFHYAEQIHYVFEAKFCNKFGSKLVGSTRAVSLSQENYRWLKITLISDFENWYSRFGLALMLSAEKNVWYIVKRLGRRQSL